LEKLSGERVFDGARLSAAPNYFLIIVILKERERRLRRERD